MYVCMRGYVCVHSCVCCALIHYTHNIPHHPLFTLNPYFTIPTLIHPPPPLSQVRQAGMLCGVCLAPQTSEETLAPLLKHWYAPDDPLIDYVDILAVNPGIGGQVWHHCTTSNIPLTHLKHTNLYFTPSYRSHHFT